MPPPVKPLFKIPKVEDIRSFSNEHKTETLLIIIVAVISFMGYSLITAQIEKLGQLDAEYRSLGEKVSPATALRAVLDQKNDFIADLPASLVEDNFITFVSEYASTYGLRIVSYKPPSAQKSPYLSKLSLSLQFIAPDFKSAILFLGTIEAADRTVRVDSWIMRPRESAKEASEPEIMLEVVFSSFQLSGEK